MLWLMRTEIGSENERYKKLIKTRGSPWETASVCVRMGLFCAVLFVVGVDGGFDGVVDDDSAVAFFVVEMFHHFAHGNDGVGFEAVKIGHFFQGAFFAAFTHFHAVEGNHETDDGHIGGASDFGHGSAMRVSSAAWLYDDIGAVRKAAGLSAEVTHNHPEGIKGAEATASAIFLARSGHGKDEIRNYIETEFNYALNRTCDEIRPGYRHVESCMETVPEAITAFLEGSDFEDVIRTAVSLGGDCDTLTAIAGSIAEAFYGVPEDLREECYRRLPEDLLEVLVQFEKRYS